MTREETILKRADLLPKSIKRKFGELLSYYLEHEYEHEDMLNKLEYFLNNFEKEDI